MKIHRGGTPHERVLAASLHAMGRNRVVDRTMICLHLLQQIPLAKSRVLKILLAAC